MGSDMGNKQTTFTAQQLDAYQVSGCPGTSVSAQEHHRYLSLTDLFNPKSLLVDQPRLMIIINAVVIDRSSNLLFVVLLSSLYTEISEFI